MYGIKDQSEVKTNTKVRVKKKKSNVCKQECQGDPISANLLETAIYKNYKVNEEEEYSLPQDASEYFAVEIHSYSK